MCSVNTWKCLSITRVFHEKRSIGKSSLKQKRDFLIQNLVFGLWFYYFCQEFVDSMAAGEAFVLLPPEYLLL